MFLLRDKQVHPLYNLQMLSATCLVKVTQQANHPLGTLQLCDPHLVPKVCFYTRYTYVPVGGSKYVQWISPQYLTQSHRRPSSSLLLPTRHIFVFELWGHSHPVLLCIFNFEMYFNGNKTYVISSQTYVIHKTLPPKVCLSGCILGTVVVECK